MAIVDCWNLGGLLPAWLRYARPFKLAMWPLNSGLALPLPLQCPLGRLQADSDGKEGHWRASAGTRRGGSAEAPTGRAGPASQRAQGPGPAPLAGQGAQLCYSAEARGHGRPGGANLNARGHRRYELTPRRQRPRPSEAALAVAVAVRSHSKLDDRRSEAALSVMKGSRRRVKLCECTRVHYALKAGSSVLTLGARSFFGHRRSDRDTSENLREGLTDLTITVPRR